MFSKTLSVLTIIALVLLAPTAFSEQSAEDVETASKDYFTDTQLLTQDGEEVRFYSDVLKDQIVVINFMFTSCQGACPMMTQKLRVARDQLDSEVADKILFVSISIDPTRDTPEAMRNFAEKQHADGNWVFLTGAQENIDLVVKKLGQYYPDVDEHSTLMIAGNVKTRLWMKLPPQLPAAGVAEKLRELVDG